MKFLNSLLASAVLATSAVGSVIFSDGVWSLPRIYRVEDSVAKEVTNYSAVEPGKYQFKAQIKNPDATPISTNLFGEVSGPENFSNTWSNISLNPGADSTRYWTENLTTPGDYNLRFSLPESSIERNFTVVPEPSTLLLLGVGGTVCYRPKRKNNSRR